MVVKELRERDWLNRQASCEAILENVPADAVVLSSDGLQGEASGVYSSWGQAFRRYNL
jgi:hypothetical protein